MNVNTTTPPSTKETINSVSSVDTIESSSEIRKNIDQLKEQESGKNQEGLLSADKIKEIAETMNDYMNELQTELRFSVHKDFKHQIIVAITNRKTDELVKQIPSDELIEIKEKMAELTGLLFDRRI